MYVAGMAANPGAAALFFDKNFGPTNPTSAYTRSALTLGSPLEGFASQYDRCKALVTGVRHS
jgi:hypothetical protein